MTEFRAAEIDRRFEVAITRFRELIAENPEALSPIGAKFEEELQSFRKRGFLTIAFVGEYSAGKSTVISALTQRRDIKISADIATDKTTEYPWGDIRLVDTPGLFTERSDHDDITYEAIRQADLLVFCLTHSLFDSVTVENFKRLAYEERYATKMMLVVNKMSSEAGDTEEKIANYKKSLREALAGHSLEEFPLCFIDALDYIEGSDFNSSDLIELSRLGTFTDALNAFVEAKGALARLDTPLRIGINHLRDASAALSRSTERDTAYLEILNRLSKAVDRGRSRFRSRVHGIGSSLSAEVMRIGINLSQVVDTPDELNAASKKAESDIEKLCQDACRDLDEAVQDAQRFLQESVEDELNSQLVVTFAAHLESGNLDPESAAISTGLGDRKKQLASLSRLGEKVGVAVSGWAQGGKAAGGLLTSTAASGSAMHQGILKVGHFLGHSFKPWQAVNLAKTIGNVAKVLGPILSVITVVVEVLNAVQEAENERKLSEARRQVVSDFEGVASGLEREFENQRQEVSHELHDKVDAEIEEARENEETDIAASNDKVARVKQIRSEIEQLLDEIAG